MPMKQYGFPVLFGTILETLFGAFCLWHSPRRKELTRAEIDRYLAIVAKLPAPNQAALQTFVSRVRTWAEADDGKPFFMLNLIHFYPQLRPYPGAPEFGGTPEESNAYYEKSLAPLWLSHAAYPIFTGAPQSKSLISISPEREWGRVVLCRYPSRRAFLKLICDPSYGPLEPYKFTALDIDLLPVSGDMVVPDLRFVVGGSLLALFFAVNWFRAMRRHRE